jgi:starch-binding outer membrane protein, SusD/RagB family
MEATMTTKNDRRSGLARAATLPIVLATMVGLSACDILDVDNPNNLLEEDIRKASAANAVVNGALSVVSIAIARTWQPVSIIADELVWIGSRDAWQQLDFGFISDPDNEFTNENFPFLGRGRWMADEAVEILAQHAQETPTTAMKRDFARANIFSALMLTVLAETQQDFVFSHKQEPGPPIGEANMHTLFGTAVQRLDRAVALAREINNADLETRALALRARVHHSRAIWGKIKPTPQTSAPLVSSAEAVADAQTVLGRVSGDWKWQLTYSSATISNEMAAWINSRGENQFDTLSVVNVLQTNVRQIQSIRIRDPIDDIPDPVISDFMTEWKSGPVTGTGTIYAPLTVVSARLMHLILAEDALQRGDQAAFRTSINNVRELFDLTPYDGQIPALDMLIHSRRVNLFLTGLRLNDMYRFGVQDPHWRPNSDATLRPGTLLPITDIEIRANPNLR